MTDEPQKSGTQRIVDITFRGTVYNVACRQEDESKLLEFAATINDMAATILGVDSAKTKVSDALLLLLACFKLLDRVEELESTLQRLSNELLACDAKLSEEAALRASLEELLNYSTERMSALVDIVNKR